MAAVDPDSFDTGRDALNTKILDIASSLAGREGTALRIVTPGERPLKMFSAAKADSRLRI